MSFSSIDTIQAEADARQLRRVLVVTALDLEMRAVRGQLAEARSCIGPDGTVYECGVFEGEGADWLVVVVESGAGNNASQSAVTAAHRAFDEFELQLLVGVGGSRKADDAPLGSVVASSRVYFPYVAKYGEDGRSGRPRQYETDARLFRMAQKVRRDADWVGRIVPPLGGSLPPRDAYPTDYPPIGHIAPMVSTEAVSADPTSELELLIASRFGDACIVEMEGYGAAYAAHQERVPAILLRGVSDMTQDKDAVRDAVLQPLAACHAAAFGFELLSLWGGAYEPPSVRRPVLRGELAVPSHPHADAEVVAAVDRGMSPGGFSDAVDIGALVSAMERASGDLLAWPRTLPGGEGIERPELSALLSTLDGADYGTTVILGEPGSGKSAFMGALGSDLLARGGCVLAIKADQLPADIDGEAGLARFLGFDEPLATVIGRVAASRPVYLLIDQLDALASYLDMWTGRLSVLLNLVRRLGGSANVHVVLSARTFEFNHDVRLRAVAAQPMYLLLPAWSEILPLLEARGVLAAGWPSDAQDVLRVPQALATYLGLEEAGRSEPMASYHAMLERLWAERLLGDADGARRSELASRLAGVMAEEEGLWLARARLDEAAGDVQALVAAGILTDRGGGGTAVGFTHQTVFDFALARGFAQAAGRLSAYVLERQESLFVRPKLWAALTYLRQADARAYEAELETIWRTDGLRDHLRLLLIDFAGQQQDPTDREAVLMDAALRSHNDRSSSLKAIAGSRGWFARFANGILPAAMSGSEDEAGRAQAILMEAWSFAPEAVVRLLKERWAGDAAHDVRTWLVLDRAARWDEQALALGRMVLARTWIAAIHVEHTVATLGVEQPGVALRLLRARLDHDLGLVARRAAAEAAEPRPEFETDADEIAWMIGERPRGAARKLLENRRDWESAPALAERAPAEYLDVLTPWYRAVFELLAALGTARPGWLQFAVAYDADFRFDGETRLDRTPSALLAGLRAAVELLALNEPDVFRAWVRENEGIDATPVQRLIAHGFAFNPGEYADEAHRFLMVDPRRLHLGSIENMIGTSTRLIAAVAPHWTAGALASFEDMVRGFRPAPPPDVEGADGRKSWMRGLRQTRLGLLRALPSHRVSGAARRQIVEEGRVFGERVAGVTFGEARMIGSIMEAEDMAKASDEDILNAFRAIPDATGWDHPTDWQRGGNIQLSRAFGAFAGKHPERAAGIIAGFEPATGERASADALTEMASVADPDLIVSLLLDLDGRGFAGLSFRTSAALAVDRLLDRNVEADDRVGNLLQRWLDEPLPPSVAAEETEDGDDAVIDTGHDLFASGDAPDEVVDVGYRSLLWGSGGGLSMMPGGRHLILRTLFHLRLRQDRAPLAVDMLLRMLGSHADGQSWRHLLEDLCHLPASVDARSDGGPGRAFLVKAILAAFPSLAGTQEAAVLLSSAQWWAPDLVREELERWRFGVNDGARLGYGELVALVAIVRPELGWAASALRGIIDAGEEGEAGRTGAALTAANLWNALEHREAATRLLAELLRGVEPGVWSAAVDLFRMADELAPDGSTRTLLEAFEAGMGTSPVFDPMFVVERLQALLPHEAPLVGRLCLRLVARLRGELADVRTGASGVSPQIVDIAITLHRLGPSTRTAGTLLFEQLLEFDAYTARGTLDEIDNRFQRTAVPRRMRLPRRRPPHAKGRG